MILAKMSRDRELIRGPSDRVRAGVAQAGICLLILMVGIIRGGTAGDDTKHAVPGMAEQKDARRRIENIYRRDIEAAKTQAAKVALARKMLETAVAMGTDDPGRFALCTTAMHLAAGAGNACLAFRAADDLTNRFAVNELEPKAQALATAAKVSGGAMAGKCSPTEFDHLIDDAIAVNRYDVAKQAASAASVFASRSHDPELNRWAAARGREVDAIAAAHRAAATSEAVLKTAADDPSALLTLGRFRCLYQKDWERGLPLLARSHDPVLRQLARDDVAGCSTAAKIQLGDRWLAVAHKEVAIPRQSASSRAAKWYRDALSRLDGLERLTVEQKLAAIASEPLTEGRGWLILFRSSDPSIWNTETDDGPERFASDLSYCPDDAQFLRLSMAGSQPVIVPISKTQISSLNHGNGRKFNWNGSSKDEWGGRHLGVFEEVSMAGARGYIDVAKGNKGWGFGHKVGPDDKQYYSWDRKEIGRVVFEIAVKSGPLTPEESRFLLK